MIKIAIYKNEYLPYIWNDYCEQLHKDPKSEWIMLEVVRAISDVEANGSDED